MRITNAITSNNLLLNLQKNMTILDKLQYQAATGNKIKYPSDDPIVAGRALKFRTGLSETNQYIQNAANAVSWLQITASSVSNVREVLFSGENSIRSRIVSAANGANGIDDRKKFITEVKELLSELEGEINATYAGRYVFSGFRTDEPPVFQKNESQKIFEVTQVFSPKQISKKEIYTKDPNDPAAMPKSADIYSIKLAYDAGISGLLGVAYTAKSSLTDAGAYLPADNEIFYVEDTGELIFGAEAYKNAVASNADISLTYVKTGFSVGEPNPVNYFDCVDLNTGKSYPASEQEIKYELGAKNRLRINSLGRDILTPALLNDIRDIIGLVENANVSSEQELRGKYAALGYSGSELEEMIKTQVQDEKKLYGDVLGNRLTELLGKLDKHMEGVSGEDTVIGSRISRVNLVDQRLRDERVNLETLKTNNESVDVDEVLIKLSSQTLVYSSALQIGAKLVQMSLVNYI